MSWKISKQRNECDNWIISIKVYDTFSDVHMSFTEEYLRNPINIPHIEDIKNNIRTLTRYHETLIESLEEYIHC